MNDARVRRGEIWFIDLDPVVGHEQGKKRPCLVISVDAFNQSRAGLAVVLPLTSVYHPIRWFIPMEPPEGGIKKKSYIISHQVRTVSLKRLSGQPLGMVSSQILAQVERHLKILLGL